MHMLAQPGANNTKFSVIYNDYCTINVIADSILTKTEIDSFTAAIHAFIRHAYEHNLPHNDLIVTVLAISSDVLSFSIADMPDTMGLSPNFVILPVHRWRNRNITNGGMMQCVLEELCHKCWRIHEEDIVAYKVHEVFQYIVRGFKIENLYPASKYRPDLHEDLYAKAVMLSSVP